VIFYSRRDGQTRTAVATCVASRRSRASRLSILPVRVVNTVAVACLHRLHRDTVAAVIWDMAEGDALIHLPSDDH
jgi:hypothetical protein